MRSEIQRLVWLSTQGRDEALQCRHSLPSIALASLGARADSRIDAEQVLASILDAGLGLTFLAGSGSRWVKTLREALDSGILGEDARTKPEGDLEAPRGLYPVIDVIRAAYKDVVPSDPGQIQTARIPMAAYALDALRPLGRQIIIKSGYEKEIRARIIEPLGLDSGPDSAQDGTVSADPARDEAAGAGRIRFFEQARPFGKPLGHGDAAWQCRDLWRDAHFVVTVFGGDATSPLTILNSILCLEALNAAGCEVDLLMPAAKVPHPGYPIQFDAAGFPRAFGHAKLQGEPLSEAAGYTNVGIRVYRAAALYDMVCGLHDRYWVDGLGYTIPGNDPLAHEFALDNVDAAFAAQGRARVLACAHPEELTPAKSFLELGAFEKAIAAVRAEWEAFRASPDADSI
jgi:hypothetical protein